MSKTKTTKSTTATNVVSMSATKAHKRTRAAAPAAPAARYVATYTTEHGTQSVDVVQLVAQAEGVTAGDYRELVGAPLRVIGRTLRKAERKGELTSVKTGHDRRYFLAR